MDTHTLTSVSYYTPNISLMFTLLKISEEFHNVRLIFIVLTFLMFLLVMTAVLNKVIYGNAAIIYKHQQRQMCDTKS